MSKSKGKPNARSKGAAILRVNSPELAAERKENKRSFTLKMLVVIVALIEAIILVVISTFSWIENSSSLIIKGERLEITGGRYFQMKIDGNDKGTVDLHKYFDDVAFYQFAKASSPDGKKLYFPKYSTLKAENADVINGDYRLGDTTDINTAYYCFDIDIYNTTSKSFNYYLKQTEKLFTVSGPDSDVNKAAEKCFRFSVQQGSVGNTIVFANYDSEASYSNDGTNTKQMRYRTHYTANSTSVKSTDSTTKAQPKVYIPNDYSFSENKADRDNHYVVCTADSDAHSTLTFRIWFEFNDPAYKALSLEDKEALNNTTVSIDIELTNASSDVRSFYLHDYSGLSKQSSLLDGDDSRSMYFAYSNGTTTSYINMVPIEDESATGYTVWRTADANGRPADLIDADMRENLKKSAYYNQSYFFYGALSDGSPTGSIKKWKLNSQPVASDGADGANIYVVYGYTGNDTYDAAGCYGMWRTSSVQPRLICFDDKMVSCEDSAYNTTGFEPIEGTATQSASPNPVFMSTGSSLGTEGASTTVTMSYDSTDGYYKGYLPSTALADDFYFTYTGGAYDTVYKVQFKSDANSVPETDPIYKALGYIGTGSLSNQSPSGVNGVNGIGTWGEITEIDLSTKLVDHLSSNEHRYLLTYNSVSYYMAGKADDSTVSFAFVPSSATSIGFKQYSTSSASSVSATWSASERGSSTTYYPVNCNTTALGYWNVAVLIDGTRDNIINKILTENGGNNGPAKLLFTYTDSETPPTQTAENTMIKIDDYRWCVPNLDTTKSTVYYWFTAYTNDNDAGTTKAEFKLEHDLSTGIYYTVVEAPHSLAGS